MSSARPGPPGSVEPSVVEVIPTSLAPGEVLSDRYRLEAEIGRGGLGIVFRARDLELERPVAVKVLKPHLEVDEARDRILREARAAAALRHPNVVAIHDVGIHERTPYFVMELIEGPSLRERPPGSLAEVVEVAAQVLSALAHAHSHGLVHRDLKPANLLVDDHAAGLSVKLVDLGLAIRERGVRITRRGGITGTVAYMAPEQALGREVDGRADLYALGVMLYEFTTGRLPFSGDNPLAVVSQHLHAPVVPPGTYNPELPEHVEATILRLLAKDPESRFATAGEVAEQLTRTLRPAARPVADGAVAALRGLVRGRLVGRESELAALRSHWAEAGAGRGGMVLISGEPGAGKTRLARELIDYAHITGGTVLAGGCYELEAATPYVPFVEALRAWVHGSTDDDLREAVGDSGAELARLAPELADRVGPFPARPALSAAEERLRLVDGITRFLFRLARPAGLLLFVDDLQWADQASLSLLHSLLRQVRRHGVLIVGSYREAELERSRPTAAELDSWSREGTVARIHLGRLDAAATSAMLKVLLAGRCPSDGLSRDIHRETEGNPFFIEETVKALVDDGQLVCHGGAWRRHDADEPLVLPQGVKAAIGRRLDRLAPATTEVLRCAAALGRSFEFAELAAVSDRPEEALLDALDEAIAAQLLEARSQDVVAFTHDKIREVLYLELNPIRRRRLHGLVLAGLETLRGDGGRVRAADLAHHAVMGGALEKGLEFAVEAATEAVSIYAYGDALRLYEQARECAEALGRAQELSRLAAAMGDVYALKGEPLAAAERYEHALAAAGDPAETLALKTKMGEAYLQVGDARALAVVEEARSQIDPSSQPAELARVIMIEGRFHHYHGQSRQAAELLTRALDAAERSGDPTLEGWILGYLAGAYQHLCELDESDRWAERAVALGEATDSPGITAVGHEFGMENDLIRGRWREGLEHIERHGSLAATACSSDRRAWNAVGRTLAGLGTGDLIGAIAAADEGLELAERLGDHRLAVFLGCWQVQAVADSGRLDEAVAGADLWQGRADQAGLLVGRLEARRTRAHVAQLAGDHDAVLARTGQAEELLDGTDDAVYPVWLAPITCASLVAQNRLAEADRRLQAALEMTRRAGMPHWEAMVLKVRGQLHLARGKSREARADLDASVQVFTDIGSRLELARTLMVRSRMNPPSEDDLERATRIFAECGVRVGGDDLDLDETIDAAPSVAVGAARV